MGISDGRQVKRPPTAAEDAERWLAHYNDLHEVVVQAPMVLIQRLVTQVRELEREQQKLGSRIAELECGRGI